jgi:glycyl-tRNA synthetase beta subunit
MRELVRTNGDPEEIAEQRDELETIALLTEWPSLRVACVTAVALLSLPAQALASSAQSSDLVCALLG